MNDASTIPSWLLRLSGVSPDDPGLRDVWFGFDGLDPGWALLLAGALTAACAWMYLRGPGDVSRRARLGLVALRAVVIVGLLLLLTKPVLQLTRDEPTRGNLLTLVDTSASQDLVDPRSGPDLSRAAIATGALSPGSADRPAPASAAPGLATKTRRDLVEAAFSNSALDLGPRISAQTDILLAPFSREAGPARPVPAGRDALVEAIRELPRGGVSTALGDSLSAALDATAGQPLTGILLVTDGASNSGAPAATAAEAALKRGLPVFIYATGIAAPRDLAVVSFTGPAVAFAREEAPLQVRLRATGLAGQSTEVVLRVGDTELKRQRVSFDSDGETELSLAHQPEKAGDLELTVEAVPVEGETTVENNRASATVRVIDRRIRVLLIEQEPRWEFRYLLDTLQRDRRVEVKAVMLDGDPGLGAEPGSPFLPELPDAAGLLENVIVVLGDVDPARLGAERMNALGRLARETGGGLVFLAGPRFSPGAYKGTPLEALLPVLIPGPSTNDPYPEPAGLLLTAAGRTSPLLKLADNPADSEAIWQRFPGARWTARTGPAKPAAEVLLIDPTPAKRSGDQAQPVLALMAAGRGQIFYFGTGDTWRWRSREGEKHYLRVWGQVFLKLGVERLAGASDLVQLNTPRPNYAPGDRVVVSGRIFDPSFQPLAAAAVNGTVRIQPLDASASAPPIESEIVFRARAGRPGEFEAEFTANARGRYTVVTERDPQAAVVFTVDALDVELRDPALNLEALEQLARATGGAVFREEDLVRLPEALVVNLPVTSVVRRIDPAFNAWLLGALILLASVEWLFRRLLRLK
jgi:hypothetical protein